MSTAFAITQRSGRSTLKRLYRFRLWDFLTTLLASAAGVIIPEVDHGLAEMLDDVSTVEVNVFHQRTAILAIKNNVLLLSRWASAFHHHAERVRRSLRGMRDIRWDKEGFTLANGVILDPLVFPDAHLDISLELVEVLFRINQMKIVSGVGAGDHHDEKVAAVIEITVTHRGLEKVAILFNPFIQINRSLHAGHGAGLRRF
jgi:hypothetical protein